MPVYIPQGGKLRRCISILIVGGRVKFVVKGRNDVYRYDIGECFYE